MTGDVWLDDWIADERTQAECAEDLAYDAWAEKLVQWACYVDDVLGLDVCTYDSWEA